MRDKKQKHKWSAQILDELLKRASLYEYEDDGRKPLPRPSVLTEEDETRPYAIVDGGMVTFGPGDDSPVDHKLAQNNGKDSQDTNEGGN